MIAATALGWLVLSPGATAVAADSALPPIATFPEEGDTAPPPDTIEADSSDGVCTDWYRQSSYFGRSSRFVGEVHCGSSMTMPAQQR
jgi:hypothetical protein